MTNSEAVQAVREALELLGPGSHRLATVRDFSSVDGMTMELATFKAAIASMLASGSVVLYPCDYASRVTGEDHLHAVRVRGLEMVYAIAA
jgi:hypothetical protein